MDGGGGCVCAQAAVLIRSLVVHSRKLGGL
ncbi:Uncharacterised protein [Bartonella vinsonii]|uniref:Uncharacterized protein n=1 Tax=Bartonella vinsonii TaxID=33047 RepID=A0A448V4M2_BARVI|nr:Uncharacterised protein [Bartonella vinsonii]